MLAMASHEDELTRILGAPDAKSKTQTRRTEPVSRFPIRPMRASWLFPPPACRLCPATSARAMAKPSADGAVSAGMLISADADGMIMVSDPMKDITHFGITVEASCWIPCPDNRSHHGPGCEAAKILVADSNPHRRMFRIHGGGCSPVIGRGTWIATHEVRVVGISTKRNDRVLVFQCGGWNLFGSSHVRRGSVRLGFFNGALPLFFSPCLAIIDLTPPWLKDFAIATFGTNDKLALFISIGAVATVLSAVVGLLAKRSCPPAPPSLPWPW